ncbi:MAG: endonuclease, partial [Marmoricola sp.]|nr:endonuclease [Marmoricola sp.]
RDRGCRAETCQRPPAWCEAHHETLPWSRGGKTNLNDGVLLCGHHHRLAHHTNDDHQHRPNGDIRFTRRT